MSSNKKCSILLIDDSTVDLRVLMELMSARQMRVNVAFNGRDGYHKAVLLQPELILLDVSMPVMDGFATCRMLKNNERTRPIPVIFLSAANEVEKRIEGLSLGAVDYIGKPFSEQEVIARVGIHLNLVYQRQSPHPEINPDEPDVAAELARRDAVLIHTATDYLRQHINSPPSPEALAKILGTNEKRLNQAFHAGFAMPVFSWLREERLRQARELLALTETPISNIAEHLGYSSGANFSKAFRERFDCSPRELRVALQRGRQQKEIEGS
ncbi:MAG: DNA-binding response regulator [Gallionella sp.]|nr:DNA-binding response regulator [Gallionella sp.]